MAPPINSDTVREYYPSVAADGTTCFLNGSAGGEIYVSENRNGLQLEPELLEYPVSTEYHEVDPVIAPDGSFIVFGSGRPGGYSFFDLYITFRRADGSWSRPVNGGKWFNTFGYSTRVNFTADGRYCIFQSGRSTEARKGEDVESIWVERFGEADVYWVSTQFIHDLRKENLHKQWAAGKIEREYQENGLNAAVALLARLSATESDTHYFSISELLMLAGRQIEAGKTDEAGTLYEAMLSTLSEPLRIKKGYAVANILNGQAEKGVALLRELWNERPSERSATSAEPIYYQLFERERVADALTLLRFLTEEFPDSHTAHHELAEGLWKAGETDQALASCLRSLELKPGYSFAEDLLQALRHPREESEELTVPKGPYLGQKPPGTIPEVFAPGIISTAATEGGSCFAPDQSFYLFARAHSDEDGILITEQRDGAWSKPQLAAFSVGAYDWDFMLTPAGDKVFVASGRPAYRGEPPLEGHRIWVSQRTEGSWSTPRLLPSPVNTGQHDSYPSVTADGTLYFFSRRDGGFGRADVYRSVSTDESYTVVENLGPRINSEHHDLDPFIAPDESYLLFCSDRPGGYGKDDVYVAFRSDDGSWSAPINLGAEVNSAHHEYIPYVTPDGKYFFFTSNKVGNREIYWVDARVLARLEPERAEP